MNLEELRCVIYLCEADASLKYSRKDITVIVATVEEQKMHNIPYVPAVAITRYMEAVKAYGDTIVNLIQLWTNYDSASIGHSKVLAREALVNRISELSDFLAIVKDEA